MVFIDYWQYGFHVEENMITYINKPPILVAISNMFVVIHIIENYQVQLLGC